MAYFAPVIMATGLITSIQVCKTTDDIGCWNLLCNKANYNLASASVTAIIADYGNHVPTSPSCSTWEYPRAVGQHVHMTANNESSEGDKSYANASIASLTSIVTLEDFNVPVTTTTTLFDLSAMEPAVGTHPIHEDPYQAAYPTQPPIPSYANVTSYSNAASSHYNPPSFRETQLTQEVAALRAQLTAAMLQLDQVSTTPSTTAADTPSSSSTGITVSSHEALLARQQAFETRVEFNSSKTEASLKLILEALKLSPDTITQPPIPSAQQEARTNNPTQTTT